MSDDQERLHDVLEAIACIEVYAAEGKARFDSDPLVQTWMIHHLSAMAESVRVLSRSLRERYPAIPWNQVLGMRHILLHQYFGIETDLVWNTIVRDLPGFRAEIERILADIR